MGYKFCRIREKTDEEYIAELVELLNQANKTPGLSIISTETGFAIHAGSGPIFAADFSPKGLSSETPETKSYPKIEYDEDEMDKFFDGWGGAK